MRDETRRWIEADYRHCWHPFTPQTVWTSKANEPLMLVKGEGVWLWDSEGRRYLDGNSSIWTNIHGHGHPRLNRAMVRQLESVAHVSYLGFAHPWASELAEGLCGLFPEGTLERVFFSDDGSTAIECAMKMSLQYWQLLGFPGKRRFLAFDQAYHGDTMGAASLGGVARFHERFRGQGAEVCFVGGMDGLNALSKEVVESLAAVVIEPMIQGVNEMRLWPSGMLAELRSWCDREGVLLILDEVMTGFGRTGRMFACEHEQVIPDFLCLAKGLTGGYLPMAATMTKGKIYDAFLGGDERAFYYGHSYTANPLGCAVALESLAIFREERVIERLEMKMRWLDEVLDALKEASPLVYEVRRCGMVAGVELRREDGERFAAAEKFGAQVCLEARKYGLLTRPIRDTLVVMPPLCIDESEIRYLGLALRGALGKS